MISIRNFNYRELLERAQFYEFSHFISFKQSLVTTATAFEHVNQELSVVFFSDKVIHTDPRTLQKTHHSIQI